MTMQYRTVQAVEFDWTPGATRYTGTIPVNVLCKQLQTGHKEPFYVVADLSWIVDIQSLLYHDAYYRGIPVPADKVEEF